MNDRMASFRHRIRDSLLPLAARSIQRPAAGGLSTILVFQPDHLGDIVLSQPAIKLLRERYPLSRLIGVVGPWSLEIARVAWAVDDLVTVEFPGFSRNSSSDMLDPYRLLQNETKRLRRLHAGRAFVLRPDAWWCAWLAAQTVSGDVVTSDDNRMKPFATKTVELQASQHSTERAILIAAENDRGLSLKYSNSSLNIPESSVALEHARHLLGDVLDQPFLVLHPGSGARVKHWPIMRWRQLIQDYPDEYFVVTGTQSEQVLCEHISRGLTNIRNIAGKTDIVTLIEIIRQAELIIGTDSGPMHLAAATGTKSIHLFGPSNSNIYRPWGDPQNHQVISADWSCSKCGDLSAIREEGCGCMLAIQASNVKRAVYEQYSRSF